MGQRYPLFNRDRIVYEYHNEYLRIGADDDDTVQIKNHTEIWMELIRLSDGTNDLESICSVFYEKYGISKEKTIQFIKQFQERHLIEVLPCKYVPDEKELYFQSAFTYYSSRGLGGLDLLERLQSLNIAVLGCGGGGSHIAFQLSQLGVGRIHIVDPDLVTVENVNRQALFTMDDIGRSKVEITKFMLESKNPFVNVSLSNERLNCVSDVRREIAGADWVFCAMDEPPYIAQRIVNKACMELKTPSVYCFSQKSAGKMFMVNPGVSGCADCLLKSCDSEEFRSFIHIFLTNHQKVITANIYPNISILCAWIVKKWLDVFCGKANDPWNKLYRYDFDLFKEEVFTKYERQQTCPTCGGQSNETAQCGDDGELWELLKIRY